MRMKIVLYWAAAAVCLIIAAQSQTVVASSEMKIGILAVRNKAAVQKQWGPIADLLSHKLGIVFSIEPLEYGQIDTVLKSGQVDFLLANPAVEALMEEKYSLKALLTMVNRKQHLPIKEFGGAVFVRRESDIRDLKDLKGKRLMCVNYTSFGGAISGWRLLLENGIDPRRDCARPAAARTTWSRPSRQVRPTPESSERVSWKACMRTASFASKISGSCGR